MSIISVILSHKYPPNTAMWKVPMDGRIEDVMEHPEDDRVMRTVVAAR